MRYHKAVAIHKVEADFIAENPLVPQRERGHLPWRAVVRRPRPDGKELEEFVADLLRAQLDELRAGLLVPALTPRSARDAVLTRPGETIW